MGKTFEDLFVYPDYAPRKTSTIICQLPVTKKAATINQVGNKLGDKVMFQIVGYNEDYARYIVEIATKDELGNYVPYSESLIATDLAGIVILV